MKALKENLGSLLGYLFELLAGVLLVMDAERFVYVLVKILGVVLMLIGVFLIIRYFVGDAAISAMGQRLFRGLLALLSGGFLAILFSQGWLYKLFPVLTVLCGVVILTEALFKVQLMADLIRLKAGRWYLPAVSAVISIFCSIVIFLNPFGVTEALWMFIGIVLVIEAVMDIILVFVNGANKD